MIELLAKFVIELHDQSKTLTDFKAKLKEVRTDFPESFVENIDRLILTLHLKHRKKHFSEANGKVKSGVILKCHSLHCNVQPHAVCMDFCLLCQSCSHPYKQVVDS